MKTHHDDDLDLEPIGVQAPWHGAIEVGPLAPCGVCGSVVSDAGVCLACLRTSSRNESRLAAAIARALRQQAKKPPPKFTPKAKDAGLFTAKERRWAARQARRTPAGRRWARSIGLTP